MSVTSKRIYQSHCAMKKFYSVQRSTTIIFLSVFISLLTPVRSIAAEGDLEIFVSCVEDLGNGLFMAYFGYNNPNPDTLTVQDKKSYIAYNYTRDEKYVINAFAPGVHEKVFSQEFVADDWVRWTVKLAGNVDLIVRADVNSERCVEALPIIPYYSPPEGGKEYASKIGAELTSLYETYSFDPAGFTGVSDNIYQLDGTRVLIEVVAGDGQYSAMISALNALGFIVVTNEPSLNRATGTIEIAKLLLLNQMTALNYARPVYPGIGNFVVPPTGLVNSQGDKAMRSDFVRLGYKIKGTGVKIGVLSNSYNTLGKALEDVGNGDLPGATNPNGYLSEVQVLQDVPSSYGTLSDEGRAMLQIVHDIAPGAQLAFRTGYLGEQDMAVGIQELAAAGADVIVDDITYITEPFFRDGVISQAIDQVVSDSVVFFSSAGNFGNASYMADFVSAPAPGTIPGVVHNFGGGDVLQAVELPEGTYTLVLQWDDGSHPQMATTTVDLDLYLSNDAGTALLGFNRENIGGFPIEVIPFSVEGDTVLTNIVVSKASGPNVPVKFKYIMFRGGSQFRMLEHVQGTSTIVGHPNAAGAIAVGAVRYDKNPIYSPLTYAKPVIMSFSSVGGTPVNGVVRSKPDITAPNGVNTTVDLGNGDWIDPVDPDTAYPNFFGTSAASPHAAAVAALILEARSKFDPGHPLGPNGIRSLMRSTALDMDAVGVDFVSGAGFLRADVALLTFANPTPYVENLIPGAGGPVPGETLDPISFTVSGDYFTEDTEILFRGDTLTEGVVLADDQTITVDHPGFLGNPLLQAYTPPISVSGLDGGYSDSTYFSDPIVQTVVITAQSATKKFGEALPAFSADAMLVTIHEDTLSLSQAVSDTLMTQAEADRLSVFSFTVAATDASGAGEYLIQPVLDPVLDVENPTTELDLGITEKFNLEFVNSSLVVEKLALKITPVDVSLTYGQELPVNGFDFLYEISDSTAIVEDLGLVLGQVETEHTNALTNEISLIRGVALVNGIPVIRGTALVNGVTMLRGTALVNGVEVTVEVLGSDTTVYVGGEVFTSGGPLARGVALVNDRPFVNMTDIRRGVALVNGNSLTIDEGFITELNGTALVNGIPTVRGTALVNGVALVNGFEIRVEGGVSTIVGGDPVPAEGAALINGIPFIRGTALVNSGNILRGTALVNDVEVPIENGTPNFRGTALVNEIALVNGIPMVRGTALVNSLEVLVEEGEVVEVKEDGTVLNGVALVNGVGFIRGTALVNGGALNRGTALVNGIALVNGSDYSDDVVNLENMNLMASATALVNGVPNVRGTALVNGLEGLDGQALKIAAGTLQPDGSIVYENASFDSRGLALVNGSNFVRGTALVNGTPFARGTALVNGSTVNENSNSGTILVFDATDTAADSTAPDLTMSPMSFITGTTAGQHWIVPGTFISNNFEISYGLGTLTIDPAEVAVTADEKSKTYGQADPELTSVKSALEGTDVWTGELSREAGEDVGLYQILQGTLDAGENYAITYTPANLAIGPASLVISVEAEDKVYDGTRDAVVLLSDDRLAGDTLEFSYTSALFADKNVGAGKSVSVQGIVVSGPDAGNYLANAAAETTASITAKALVIGVSADDKVYDGGDEAVTAAFISEGLVDGDDVSVASSGGLFDTRNVGNDKTVSADVSTSGLDAGNYLANAAAETTASITARDLVIGVGADDKVYDGSTAAITAAFISEGLVEGDAVTVSSSGGLFTDKNVGIDKLVNADVAASGADAGNYLANATAATTASITAKALVVGLSADDKVYDGSTEALSAAFISEGLVDGDDVSVSSSGGLFDTRNVGSNKTVRADIATSGLDAGNYLANATAETTASITAKDLVIGITADDKVYDGLVAASTTAFIESGLVPGDAVTVSSSGSLFADKNVGSDKVVNADVAASGTDAGNYLANATAAATASITKKGLVIGLSADDKVYDGSADAATMAYILEGLVEGDAVSVSSSGGLFDNKNVGSGKTVNADVSASGLDAGNYLVNATAATTASITAKDLVVGLSANDKVYDGNAGAVSTAYISEGLVNGDGVSVASVNGQFDTKNVGSGKTVSADITTSGLDAGNYLANPTAQATASITVKDLLIGLNANDKEYDGTTLATTSAYVMDGLVAGDAVSVSSSGGLFDTRDVGTNKPVTASVSASGADAVNYLANTSAAATADITPKEVTVTAVEPFLYIDEGDPLPVFAFTYLGWIPGDPGNVGYTVLRDSDGATYNPASSESAGSYTVTPTPSNGNYAFVLETGTLHVNPYGPGTRAVKPVLNCIQEISTGYYVANFEYKNENSATVYVPLGEDNYVSGQGIDWANSDPVPTFFEPGGGSFRLFFYEGSELSWVVSSRESDQKVRNAANANSSSTKCKGNGKKSASVTTGVKEILPAPDELVAYPNPVGDKLYISMKDIEHYKMIVLYDFAGRSHPVTSVDKRSDQLEIDMVHLSPGHYFIRIEMEDSTRVVPIIKQ